MNILRKSKYTAPPLPSEERELLRGERAVPQLASPRRPVLSKETLAALEELGDILRRIDRRMEAEGYEIVDGRVRHKKTGEYYVDNTR